MLERLLMTACLFNTKEKQNANAQNLHLSIYMALTSGAGVIAICPTSGKAVR